MAHGLLTQRGDATSMPQAARSSLGLVMGAVRLQLPPPKTSDVRNERVDDIRLHPRHRFEHTCPAKRHVHVAVPTLMRHAQLPIAQPARGVHEDAGKRAEIV